jgi:hypothetical protein
MQQPLGDHKEPGDIVLVFPVDAVGVGTRGQTFVWKRALDRGHHHLSHEVAEIPAGGAADKVGHGRDPRATKCLANIRHIIVGSWRAASDLPSCGVECADQGQVTVTARVI